MLPRGAAGVTYGNPVHLLDAARYIKFAWDAVWREQLGMRSTLQVSASNVAR